MEKTGKIRICCINCLYTKILPIHESDPVNTRLIISESCEKCDSEADELKYFDSNMVELHPFPSHGE